jgi:DNA-directed RNA polymerase specialized sigma24 family protein
MPKTSLTLLQKVRDPSDEASWLRLVTIYKPILAGWLQRERLQPQDAEDIAAEVLAVLVSELRSFQHSGQTGAFRHWLRNILANRLRAFWRARQHHPYPGGDNGFLTKVSQQLEDPSSDLSRQGENGDALRKSLYS